MNVASCREPEMFTQCMVESAMVAVVDGSHGPRSVAATCVAFYICFRKHCVQEPPRSI